MTICRTCGAGVPYPGRGRPPVRCEKCRAAHPYEAHQGLWTQRDWDAVPLGQTWDTALAEQLGCSVTSVCDARSRRGIPKHTETRICPCGNEFTARQRDHLWCSARCSNVYGGAIFRGVPEAVALTRVALSALHRDMYGDGRIGRSDWSVR